MLTGRTLALFAVVGLVAAVVWGGFQRAGAHDPAPDDDRATELDWPAAHRCHVVADGCRYAVVGDSVSSLTRHEFLARGGETFANGGVDIETGRDAIRRLAARGDEPIVINLGLMDTSRHATAEQLQTRIRQVLEDDVATVSCVVWVDIKETSNVHHHWPGRSQQFNRILDGLAEEFERPVAHWSDQAAGHPNWFQSDGIHPNSLGQRKLAHFITRSVRSLC